MAGGRWFEPVADHLGAAYLRYSFTYGTDQEADFLVRTLGLRAGDRVLDVGCGPGRHVRALAQRGLDVVGLDLSARFLEVAQGRGAGRYVRGDASQLPVRPGSFDVALSLCQGGFGLMAGPPSPAPVAADPDGAVLAAMAGAVRPGGLVVISAFSAYFQVRFLESSDRFDAATGVNEERTEIRSETGETASVDVWTSCFTPRELRLLAADAGLSVRFLWAVTPGDYAARPPDLDHPEFLLVAAREGA